MPAPRSHDELAARARRPPTPGVHDDRELVRLATLAASSHNTQPWLFSITAGSILIRPDRARRCPVADPHDAHLYKSLGCAAENLVHAASIQGRDASIRYDETLDAVVVDLTAARDLAPTALSAALTTRQCTKTRYDGTPLTREERGALERTGSGDGVTCVVVTDPDLLVAISDLVARGNRAQLTDARFRDELVSWIRFNPRASRLTRDGLAGRVNGQPPLPTLLGRLMAPLVVTARGQVRKDRAMLASSAGVALFVTADDDRRSWVEAGRAFERFSLLADLLGVRSAFMNQPIEVPELRPELQRLLDDPGHAQLMVRVGRAPRAPYSLRRPIDDVIVGQTHDARDRRGAVT